MDMLSDNNSLAAKSILLYFLSLLIIKNKKKLNAIKYLLLLFNFT